MLTQVLVKTEYCAVIGTYSTVRAENRSVAMSQMFPLSPKWGLAKQD